MVTSKAPDTCSPPLLDMTEPESDCMEALAAACNDWAFFQITSHGIPADLLHAALTVTKIFFDQPSDDKQALSRTRTHPWGYYDQELTINLTCFRCGRMIELRHR